LPLPEEKADILLFQSFGWSAGAARGLEPQTFGDLLAALFVAEWSAIKQPFDANGITDRPPAALGLERPRAGPIELLAIGFNCDAD
jgi:hypothetical protein